MTTHEELIDTAIRMLDAIAEQASRLTTGNVSHNKATIEGMAKRTSEHLKKRK